MNTLYLECNMGASGDMLMGALFELHPDPGGFLSRMSALNLEGVSIDAAPAVRCGITGTHMCVRVNGIDEGESCHARHHTAHRSERTTPEHHHAHPEHIHRFIDSLRLPATVAKNAHAVYDLLAEAEASVHGCTVDAIHFHEVGTLDAITDIIGVCWLMDDLAPERIIASPVTTGYGSVHCAHGILPVPAPAVLHILRGVPIRNGHIESELCTPTGAALLRHFVSSFSEPPAMTITRIGYGMGHKDLPAANCLRAMLGTTAESTDDIIELSCNIDDITSEDAAFAIQLIMEAGALDATASPILMKKGRPAMSLSCLCTEANKEAVLNAVFRNTTTLGVREKRCRRHIMERHTVQIRTPLGSVQAKIAQGYGINRVKPEFEDIAALARKHNLPMNEVRAIVAQAMAEA